MPPLTPLRRRILAELGFLVIAGLFIGALAPFDSSHLTPHIRYAYWLICIVGGGLIGIAIDGVLARRMRRTWLRLLLGSVAMTPPVGLLVIGTGDVLTHSFTRGVFVPGFLWQVFVISVAVMAVRALLWRPAKVVTHTRVEPPLPGAEAAFRRRLSARRRTARLIAVEAEDHYLRAHTDAGSELIALRMADAVDELAGVHGYRTHRSWWVAADAIDRVVWRKGGGEAQLAGGLTAPVSRSYAAVLKDAGWR